MQMKVSGPGKNEFSVIRRKGVSRPDSGGGFSTSLTRDAAQTSHVQGAASAAPAHAVSALLSLQEVEDQGSGRKRSLTRAETMLDLLDEIRHGILIGAIPRHKLRQMLQLCKTKPEAYIDASLSGIVSDIELRAKVELAKIEMSEKHYKTVSN